MYHLTKYHQAEDSGFTVQYMYQLTKFHQAKHSEFAVPYTYHLTKYHQAKHSGFVVLTWSWALLLKNLIKVPVNTDRTLIPSTPVCYTFHPLIIISFVTLSHDEQAKQEGTGQARSGSIISTGENCHTDTQRYLLQTTPRGQATDPGKNKGEDFHFYITEDRPLSDQ